jgi:hypothetical protein
MGWPFFLRNTWTIGYFFMDAFDEGQIVSGIFSEIFSQKSCTAKKIPGKEKFLCEKFPVKKSAGKNFERSFFKKTMLFLWMDDNF